MKIVELEKQKVQVQKMTVKVHTYDGDEGKSIFRIAQLVIQSKDAYSRWQIMEL